MFAEIVEKLKSLWSYMVYAIGVLIALSAIVKLFGFVVQSDNSSETAEEGVKYTFEYEKTIPVEPFRISPNAIVLRLTNRGPSDCVNAKITLNKYYVAMLSDTKERGWDDAKSNSNTIINGSTIQIGFSDDAVSPFRDEQGRTLDGKDVSEIKIECNDGSWID